MKIGRVLFGLSAAIFSALLSFHGCKHTEVVFEKEKYLSSCGLDIERMKLSDRQVDSLISQLPEYEIENIKWLHDCFNTESCLELMSSYFGRLGSGDDSLLSCHYFARGIDSLESKNDIIRLTLFFSDRLDSEDKLRVAEESYRFVCDSNDSLSAGCVKRILQCEYPSYPDTLYYDEARRLFELAKQGQIHLSKAYPPDFGEYDCFFSYLANLSYLLNDSSRNDYADSLFECSKRIGWGGRYRYLNDETQSHLEWLLANGYYSRADEIVDSIISYRNIDLLTGSRKPLLDTGSISRINEISQERQHPDATAAFGSNSFTLRLLNRHLHMLRFSPVLDEKFQGVITALDEYSLEFWKARTSYLLSSPETQKWLDRGFYEGVKQSFPSMSSGFVSEMIAPSFSYTDGLLKAMTLQYNNQDPGKVYESLIYIKHATYDIPSNLLRYIKESEDGSVREMAELVRRKGSESTLDNAQRHMLEAEVGTHLAKICNNIVIPWEEIRDSLTDNSVAVEFFACPDMRFPDRYVYKAAVLRKDYSTPVIVELCSDSLLKAAVLNRDEVKLYSSIWAQLEKMLSPGDTVYFSPDRLLNIVNLSSLKSPEDEYLFDRYIMRQVSSTREICFPKSVPQQYSILAFGGLDYGGRKAAYLPFSQKEVLFIDSLARIYGNSMICRLGRDGTEDALYDSITDEVNLIHFSTHSLDFPSAGILMSRKEGREDGSNGLGDGLLELEEISRLDLTNVSLVVLAACNTAIGSITEEGVEGLQKAFKKAGAGSLLMTLSKVDDEATALFVKSFYTNLFQTMDRYEAYRFAVNALRNSDKFSAPKYWSPFILVD